MKKLSTALSQDAEVEGRRLNGRTRQSQTPAYGRRPAALSAAASPHNTLDKASHGVGSLARRVIKGRRETAGARQHSADLLARHIDCAEPVEQPCRVGERVTQDMKLNGLLAFSI